MSVLRHIRRLQYIDFLVRRKATGNLEGFANKNRLSKSGLMQVLKEMKEIGFPIKYSRSLHSYYYEREGQMVKSLFSENQHILSNEMLKQVSAEDIKGELCYSEITIFEQCNKL